MKDHLISRSKFLDALVLDADNKTDLIQVHHALEKAVVDPAEVRGVGEWMTHSDRADTLICSICNVGFDMWKWEQQFMRYCPSCGARMEVQDGKAD